MNGRAEIIKRLERYVYEDDKAGKAAFFDALADAALWNKAHPDEVIPKMIGGRVPVPCAACGDVGHGRCGKGAAATYCCVGCERIPSS